MKNRKNISETSSIYKIWGKLIMEYFDIVVGIFSILSSIATLISTGILISIKIQINQKGSNNSANSITQSNHGKDNQNNIR